MNISSCDGVLTRQYILRLVLSCLVLTLVGCGSGSDSGSGVSISNSAPTVSTVIITVNGDDVTEAVINDTLTVEYQFADADNGDTDASTFQWQRDGNPISGATSRQYTVIGEDVVGSLITVQVTPVDDKGASGTAESSATVIVNNSPPAVSDVIITRDGADATGGGGGGGQR